MYRAPGILLALLLAIALSFGGFVHAAVPHDDGGTDDHSSKHIVWGSLHTAVQHEDRMLLLGLLYLSVFAVLLPQMRSLVMQTPLGIEALDKRNIQLRRGIAAYRRFS